MSVMTLSDGAFQAIHAAVRYAGYNKTCDVRFNYTAMVTLSHKDTDKESERLVRNWVSMNDRTYAARYKEEVDDSSQLINLRSAELVAPLQVIKYLQCLVYNIETSTLKESGLLTEQDEKDFELLVKILEDFQCAYIGKLEEYEKAKWG